MVYPKSGYILSFFEVRPASPERERESPGAATNPQSVEQRGAAPSSGLHRLSAHLGPASCWWVTLNSVILPVLHSIFSPVQSGYECTLLIKLKWGFSEVMWGKHHVPRTGWMIILGLSFQPTYRILKRQWRKQARMELKIRLRDVRTSTLAGGKSLLILIPVPTHQLIRFCFPHKIFILPH